MNSIESSAALQERFSSGGRHLLHSRTSGPKGCQFLFHLCDQHGQLLFTFRFCGGIDIPGHALAVDLGGVVSLPFVFSGAASAVLFPGENIL